MALEVHDRVKETTTTTGSSDAYALGGAVTGFETFASHLDNTDTTYYVCTDGTNFEIGIGTYNTSGNTLTRTEILGSDFTIEGKLQLQYGAELEKDPEQSGVTVRSIAS